jgi:thymidylate synthase
MATIAIRDRRYSNLYMYPNSSSAFLNNLQKLINQGSPMDSRLGPTKELIAQLIDIQNPLERVYLLPGLKTNIFAQIAGSWWVMAGTNDLDFLSFYWPGADKRSDDRITWRGAYGPRLRHWNGIDQLEQIVKMLKDRPQARRATLTIFDPMHDFAQSKDVACAVSLHFLIRNNQLHLTVDMRSVDIWLGGFAGPNTFEWSVLQECVAFWLGVEVGPMHFFANSLHLYEQNEEQAKLTLQSRPLKNPYDDQSLQKFKFQTPFDQFNSKIKLFFELENCLRQGQDIDHWQLRDELLQASLLMLEIYICERDENRRRKIPVLLNQLGHSDFGVAARNWLENKD